MRSRWGRSMPASLSRGISAFPAWAKSLQPGNPPGYQHRGIEQRLTQVPWPQARYLAESASSDTAAGHALAHALALEQILGVAPPPRAAALRTLALELERLANHVGDIGALAGDIGYSPGASLFPPLRGATLALAQLLTGNRRQRWFIQPGGVVRDSMTPGGVPCCTACANSPDASMTTCRWCWSIRG